MKLAWTTDLHLDFLKPEGIEAFTTTLERSDADAFLMGGDISKAPTIEAHLLHFEARLNRPIYFVLGNHDFYKGSIPKVREMAGRVTGKTLRWLPKSGVISLSRTTALLGHDGWGDARAGNYANTPVLLNDFLLIKELSGLSGTECIERLRELGTEAADYVRAELPKALETHQKVIFLTHVPPFKEACWHEGKISGDDWLPYFTCQAVGDVLRDCMLSKPNCELTVLCGHTHGAGIATILPNLVVRTAGVQYGAPCIQLTMEIV